VTIREFEPDKTKVTAQIVTENKQGWINQSDIIAKVTAKNLFGTPPKTVELRVNYIYNQRDLVLKNMKIISFIA